MGIIAAIVELAKLINQLLTLVIPLINLIVDYQQAQNKRLKDAAAAEEEAKRKATEEQLKKEQANINAFKAVMEDAWKIRYEQILGYIKAEQYDQVLILRKEVNNPDVDYILFNEVGSAEYKALKIVELMRKTKMSGV